MTAWAAVGAALIHPATADASPRTAAAHGNEEARDGDWGTVPAAVPVPLERWFDNDGIDTADAPGGNFDGSGYTFPGEELPSGQMDIDGIAYLFPAATAGAKNNIVALGQRIELPRGRYLSGLFLVAGSYGAASGKATVHYADGTTQDAALGGPDWYSGSGSLTAPYRYNPAGQKDPHQVVIATAELAMDSAKEAVALTLPVTNPAQPNRASLHIFALTLQPAAQGRALALRDAHSTTSLLDSGAQSVEATVINAGTVGILASDRLTLSVDVPGARTVAPAAVRPNKAFYIHSLAAPGSTLTVEAPVAVQPGDKVTMLGHGRPLAWRTTGGKLVIDVPAAARRAGKHVWVFKAAWSA